MVGPSGLGRPEGMMRTESGRIILGNKKIRALEPAEISRFLVRQRREKEPERLDVHLDQVLCEILAKADEFVPSEAGSILLDDPRAKMGQVSVNRLTFIAVFGPMAEGLLGKSMGMGQGIAGHVYESGRPYIAEDVSQDAHFDPDLDEESGFVSRSVIAVPVILGQSICGVLELVNRIGAEKYTSADLALIETFAGYISSSIQNALDVIRVRELARRDDLTGLFNDRFLHVRLGDEVERADRNQTHLSVIFMDLDFFKRVNDTYGHLVGSQVLRDVGRLMDRWAPPGAVTARYGGDEFVAILPGHDAQLAEQVAENLRNMVGRTRFLAEIESNGRLAPLGFPVTCSVGVASLHEHVPPVGNVQQRQNALLRLADEAMYSAKAQGKNQVVVAEPGE